MDFAPWFLWLKLIHVLAALGLVLTHGASAAVAFKLRGERDRVRIQALVELSNAYLNAFYLALVVVLVAGILTGIAGGYWTSGQLWIWASLVLFIGIVLAMYGLATPYFENVRHAVGLPTFNDKRRALEPPPPLSDADLALVLTSRRPIVVAAVGLGGVALLAYLMIIKPF